MKSIIDKLFSGRYFLTICAGCVFVYCSIHSILTPETIAVIIVGVMKDYFNKIDKGSGNVNS